MIIDFHLNVKFILYIYITCLVLIFPAIHVNANVGSELSLQRIKYDDRDRIIAIEGPGKRNQIIQYNERGQVSAISKGKNKEKYNYNLLGQLKSFKDATGTTELKIKPNGQLISMKYPSGEKVSYQYSMTNALETVSLDDQIILGYTRDLFGNLVEISTAAGKIKVQYDYNKRIHQRMYPNGAFSLFELNVNGKANKITHVLAGGSVFLMFEYKYNDAGLLLEAQESSRQGNLRINYSYDPYGQLNKATYSDGREYAYNYDIFGNIQELSSQLLKTKLSYHKNDQLKSINGENVKHDEAGNVTQLAGTPYVFDEDNALIKEGNTTYQYNALGYRVKQSGKQTTVNFYHLIQELPYVLIEKGKSTKQYLWADKKLLGQITDNKEALFFFEDHLGSIRAAVDAKGNIVGFAEFSPYGKPIKRIPNVRYGFTGEEQDINGKVYLRARYYDPNIARFLSKDPVLQNLYDSGKQNLYAYVGNSPTNYLDKDGAEREPVVNSIENPPRVALGEQHNWTDEEMYKAYIINTYGKYYNAYVRDKFKDQPILSIANVKLARQDAYKKFVSDNYAYPWAVAKSAKNSRNRLSRKTTEFRLPLNTVMPSNIGLINWDWMTTVGHYTKVYKYGSVNMFDAYYFAKPKWNVLKSAKRHAMAAMVLGSFGVEHSWIGASAINAKGPANLKDILRTVNFKEEVGPIQDLNAMTSGELMYSGEIRPEHLLLPKYKSSLIDFIENKNNNYFLPLENKPEPVKQNITQQSKSLADHIMSGINKYEAINERFDIISGPGQTANADGSGGFAGPGAIAANELLKAMKNSSTPNIGGVYLDKAADIVGNLSSIEAVTFDPLSNRLILIGTDGTSAKISTLNIEDLATAYKTVFGNQLEAPGVTIDPNPENPHAETMLVRFFGGVENTRLGFKIFEADRQMKGLSLGEDNINREKIKANIKGYYNLLDLGFSNLAGEHNNNLWSRFWLVPEKVIVQVADDKNSISFPDTRIRINTETMRWENGKLIPEKNLKNQKAEYFAGHFTKYYDQYAKEFPVFKELKELTNIIAFLKWVKESGLPVKLDWLDSHFMEYKTPTSTPSLTTSDKRKNGNIINTISIFGGTDLTVENFYAKDDGTAKKYAKASLKAVSDTVGMGVGKFKANDNSVKSVIALPTSESRNAGAKLISENELGLLPRVFCSFHNEFGEFGKSWYFDLPKLHISIPQHNKTESVVFNAQKVEKKNIRITRPFGVLDVEFGAPIVDQKRQKIAYLPENPTEIYALYPLENGQYQLEYKDGRKETFNAKGKIVKSSVVPTVDQVYKYSKNGELSEIDLLEKNISVVNIKLSYDKTGRVHSADANGTIVKYVYNDKDELIFVNIDKEKTEYLYDNQHLVTQIKLNGKAISTFKYDTYGRLEAWGDQGEKVNTIAYQNEGSSTVVTQYAGINKIARRYDAGGRLLDVTYGTGEKISGKYRANGTLEKQEIVNRFADKQIIEYSEDGLYTKYIDPENTVQGIMLDKFGRLIQIDDGERLLLEKNYGHSKIGWLETAKTSDFTSQIVYDDDNRMKLQTIEGSSRTVGQIRIQYKYDSNGKMANVIVSGLLNGEHQFDDGKLVKQISGNRTTIFEHDRKGYLKKLVLGKQVTTLDYDNDGLLKTVEYNNGKHQEFNKYTNGNLIERLSGDGLKDKFTYNENNLLNSFAREDGEHWSITRKARKVTFNRNGLKHLEFSYDEKGRLAELAY